MCLCCRLEKQEMVVNLEFLEYRDNYEIDYEKFFIDILI